MGATAPPPHGQLHPERAVLPGVWIVGPIQQGEYDGLCGLYAIINAIQLVCAPQKLLRPMDVSLMFGTGIRFIDRNASLAHVVTHSVGPRLWPTLGHVVTAKARRLTGLNILLDQPLRGLNGMSAPKLLDAIEAMI